MSDRHPWSVYAEQLTPAGHGFPVYFPEHPWQEYQQPAQIGDVGIIINGKFKPFFNVVDKRSPVNTDQRLPHKYEELVYDRRLNDHTDGYLPPDKVMSETVQSVSAEATGGTGDMTLGVGVGGSFKIKTTKEKAACLFLNDHSELDWVMQPCNTFYEYVEAHERHWKEYFRTMGFDYKEHGIVLVTGAVKTSSWGIAVMSGGSTDHQISFSAPVGPVASAGAGFVYETKNLPSRAVRKGPLPLVNAPPSIGYGKNNPLPRNQTIFLRYIKIKYRWKLIRSLEAAGSKRADASGDDGSPEPEIETSESLSYDPLDDVLDYILGHSDADMAIASTEDIKELSGSGWPANVKFFLEATRPPIKQTDGEVKRAYLSIEDMIIKRNTLRYIYHAPMDIDPVGDPGAPGPSSRVDHSKSSMPPGITSGTLILERKLRDPVPDLDWPHRLFLERGTEGGAVIYMSVSPDGRYVASCFEDKAIRIWSLESEALAYRLINDEGGDTIFSVAWSKDSTKLISGSNDANGVIWLISGLAEEIAPTHVLEGHIADVQTVAMSPDGTKAATGSVDASAKLWDVETGNEYATLDDLSGMVLCTTFSQDSKQFAVAADSSAWVCNADTGERLVELQGHDGLIWALSFASNGARIVTGSEDHTARVWDVETGDELVTIREHSGPVWSAVFSPNDKEVLTGSYDSLVSVCDSYTGETRLSLRDRPSIVNVASYTPGGDYIVAGCADGAVKIWQNATGKFIAEIQGHKDKVKNLDYTPDGNKIVTSGDDGTVRVWDLLDILRIA